jgi:acetoin utilization protein AcuB
MVTPRLDREPTLKVRDVMHKDAPSAAPGETAAVAWSRMNTLGVEHLVVIQEGKVVGTLAARDLSGPMGGGHRRMGRTVAELMRSDVGVATPGTTVARAAGLMRRAKVDCLPILERGKLVGIVTTREMLGILARRG